MRIPCFAISSWALVVVALAGCERLGSARPTSISDPRLAPMLKAIAAVDRASLGFSPISGSARVSLEEGGKAPYDAMLHIYAETSRVVAFRKTDGGYRWIEEQEVSYGPGSFTTVDGTFQENLVVEYQLERVNGIPNNQIYISYSGTDVRLAGKDGLTLADIKPFLDAWKGTPIR